MVQPSVPCWISALCPAVRTCETLYEDARCSTYESPKDTNVARAANVGRYTHQGLHGRGGVGGGRGGNDGPGRGGNADGFDIVDGEVDLHLHSTPTHKRTRQHRRGHTAVCSGTVIKHKHVHKFFRLWSFSSSLFLLSTSPRKTFFITPSYLLGKPFLQMSSLLPPPQPPVTCFPFLIAHRVQHSLFPAFLCSSTNWPEATIIIPGTRIRTGHYLRIINKP